MNRKLFYVTLTVLLALLLSIGGATAQEPRPEAKAEPQEEVTITAVVNSRIGYQGILKESGTPVTGSRNMIFRLYSNNTCTTQVGTDIVKNGVSVTDGLFSVELDVDYAHFNGQGLWLAIEVGGTQIGCQEILPVPYALSLRPGALVGADNATYGLRVVNTGTGHGILGHALGAGTGVEGYSPSGYAGYFKGDVGQDREDDGLVKAAVYAVCSKSSSNIYRGFNHGGGTTTIANGLSIGSCTIDFGFKIDDRFWVATALAIDYGASCSGYDTKLYCCTFYTSTGTGSDGDIMVLVY